jgi:hypothetical protein
MPVSDRKTARLVGWLFLGTFAFSIPGFLLYGPLLDHPKYILGSGHDTQISFGALLEILTAVCNIGAAVALYPVARRYASRAALGYVAVRIVESTMIVAGIVSVLGVVTLRRQFAGTDVDPETLTIAGQSLVAFHDWTFLLGPGFCSGIGNGVLLGFILYASGLLPRRLAAFGMLAGSFAIVAAAGALFGVYERQSGPQMLLTFPEMVWELTFGIHLIVRGFAPTVSREDRKRRPAAASTAGTVGRPSASWTSAVAADAPHAALDQGLVEAKEPRAAI